GTAGAAPRRRGRRPRRLESGRAEALDDGRAPFRGRLAGGGAGAGRGRGGPAAGAAGGGRAGGARPRPAARPAAGLRAAPRRAGLPGLPARVGGAPGLLRGERDPGNGGARPPFLPRARPARHDAGGARRGARNGRAARPVAPLRPRYGGAPGRRAAVLDAWRQPIGQGGHRGVAGLAVAGVGRRPARGVLAFRGRAARVVGAGPGGAGRGVSGGGAAAVRAAPRRQQAGAGAAARPGGRVARGDGSAAGPPVPRAGGGRHGRVRRRCGGRGSVRLGGGPARPGRRAGRHAAGFRAGRSLGAGVGGMGAWANSAAAL
ncbi:MAG: hypothetical protein AVDCRST_MAG04-2202, partial [uncultured Acetobacteraceae bacterium]